MGCNCRKNTPRPLGPNGAPATQRTEKYVLRTPTGTHVFGSRLEAEAEKRRSGGGMITRRVD